MTRHKCNDLNCPDCHPEHWQPDNHDYDAYKGPGWTWLLLPLLLALALVYVRP